MHEPLGCVLRSSMQARRLVHLPPRRRITARPLFHRANNPAFNVLSFFLCDAAPDGLGDSVYTFVSHRGNLKAQLTAALNAAVSVLACFSTSAACCTKSLK